MRQTTDHLRPAVVCRLGRKRRPPPTNRQPCSNPTPRPRNLLQLFAAAYLQYSRYLNPNTGEAGSLFDVIDYLATVKRKNDKLRGELYCVGMSLWKRAVAKPFFNVPSCRLKFISSTQKLAGVKLSDDTRILAWGNGKEAIVRFAEQHHIPLLRMEDGFIRSVGLSSNLVPPLSLVTDDMGIYFNAETPSRLEHILQNQNFDDQRPLQNSPKSPKFLPRHLGDFP